MATPPQGFGPGTPTPTDVVLQFALNTQDDADLFAILSAYPGLVLSYNVAYSQGKSRPKIHNYSGKNFLGIKGLVENSPIASPTFSGTLTNDAINAINSGQSSSSVLSAGINPVPGLYLPSSNSPYVFPGPIGPGPTIPITAGVPRASVNNPGSGSPSTIVNPSPSNQRVDTGSNSVSPFSVNNVAGSTNGGGLPVQTVNSGLQNLLSEFGSNPVVLIGIATAIFLMFGMGSSGSGRSRE